MAFWTSAWFVLNEDLALCASVTLWCHCIHHVCAAKKFCHPIICLGNGCFLVMIWSNLILKVRRTSDAVCVESPLPRKPTSSLIWSFIQEPRTSSVITVTRLSTGSRILSSTCIRTRCKDTHFLIYISLFICLLWVWPVKHGKWTVAWSFLASESDL